jgi:hypothetical protein
MNALACELLRRNRQASAGPRASALWPDPSIGAEKSIRIRQPQRVTLERVFRTLPLVDMLNKVGGPPTDFEDFVSHDHIG